MLLPTTLLAYDFENNGIYYNIHNSNTVGVCQAPKGENSETMYKEVIIIPEKVNYEGNEYWVRMIDQKAFYETTITNVVLPNTITFFDEYSFAYSTIKSISCPESLIEIGKYAFYRCEELEQVELNKELKTINYEAFYSCSKLHSIVIPSSLEKWHRDGSTFYDCIGLENIILEEGIKAKGGGWNFFNTGVKEAVIPNSMSIIEEGYFENCAKLRKVTIGSGIKSISKYAFDGCCEIQQIYCKPTTPPSCGKSCFDSDIKKLAILYVPKGCLDLYKSSSTWMDFWNIEEMDFSDGESSNDDNPYQEIEVNVTFLDASKSIIEEEFLSINLPIPEEIEGYVFDKWVILGGNLDEGIKIQAIYSELSYACVNTSNENDNPQVKKILKKGQIYIVNGPDLLNLSGIKVNE